MSVKAKKHLGQHFLTDENIARKIVEGLSFEGYQNVMEVGPGMGVLTKYLLERDQQIYLAEIDNESIEYLKKNYSKVKEETFVGDFLKQDFQFMNGEQIAIIGNFPYNISSQIVFKCLELREQVPEFSGMFQKEVAERICEKNLAA